MFSKISNSLEEGVISLLLIGMTILVFVEVVARFFFNTGFMWIAEATLTCGAWFILFGMSYGVKVGAHIGVDAFVTSLQPRVKKITSVIAVLVCLCYCSLFIYGSVIYLTKMYDIGIAMEDVHLPAFIVNSLNPESAWEVFKIDVEDPLMPIWLIQSILLLGFCLLFFRFFQLFVKIIQGKAEGFKFADEAKESMHLIQGDPSKEKNTIQEQEK
jgi:C4-dicarboxylate transporter DctQ subunit